MRFDRTIQEIEVLGYATGGNMAADETLQKIAVIPEGFQLKCQQLAQIRADIELLHHHQQPRISAATLSSSSERLPRLLLCSPTRGP
ncbi:hypothetical protein N7447_007879 [Penicillium robsamsonii]|uniref:uncharacterized protein n=1 Tax=Penicillium robsamsonii TaxID=1792511 RepID=UPI00254801F4|nr:uncharacterized protein N7447_007879 [Penicillium robsamsonii]KAJ5817871.1 hypothetical protein N7447_007879 [Penicillium robsamsonii]